ncbi:retrotransposon protein, putative, ty1-copia subclass [Tanacetum coccineum]|uniref:Retrotransposon protein, putative, ty1-copia subclass n=1 Tax=Tanacetum coccineum TaxID=301880 RepID=A0ABQ4WPI6_9ASTR
MEVEGFEPPKEEEIPIRKSERSRRVPNRLCLDVEAKEHSLGDLNEPTSYIAAMLDPEFNKWLDTMNAEMQSMIDNKGYTQLYGVDYEETFSPMADIRAIMILMSIATFYDYEIWQMDVKTAFLNGYLDEDIYMVQPEGFVDPKHPRKILKKYRMDNSKRSHIPMQERLDLNKTQGASTPEEVKPELRVDCHCDAGFETDRDDIKSLTRYVFVLNGGAMDWKSSKQSTTAMSATEAEYIAASEAAMKVVWIRKFISGLGIVPTINEPIKMFCDNCAALLIANELGVQKGARSKQSTIAMSVIEAKYIATSEAAMEAVWIRKFISELGIVPKINEPIRMFCDNSAALHFANEPGAQRGARHYHRRYHYVRESITLGEIRFLKVHTDDNLADPFTKVLSKGKLTQHARSMGLRLANSFM